MARSSKVQCCLWQTSAKDYGMSLSLWETLVHLGGFLYFYAAKIMDQCVPKT